MIIVALSLLVEAEPRGPMEGDLNVRMLVFFLILLVFILFFFVFDSHCSFDYFIFCFSNVLYPYLCITCLHCPGAVTCSQ